MTLFQKFQNYFHQTSIRFHSAVATLEPQKHVIAITVWTEIILLVSWRLVQCFSPKFPSSKLVLEAVENTLHLA